MPAGVARGTIAAMSREVTTRFAPGTIGPGRRAWAVALAMLLAAATAGAAGSDASAPLRACASDVDFPPFVMTSSSGFPSGSQNTGLAVNVLQRALRRAGREPAVVERLPWRRCRESVANGEFQIALDVPTRELDAKRYIATAAYAEIHRVYIYSPRQFPAGPPLHALADLKRRQVCALAGSRLDADGIDAAHQDTGAHDERGAILKVAAGRCEVFIEYREVVDSLFAHDAGLQELFRTLGLRRMDLPDDAPTGLHFELGAAVLQGAALQQSFNATIRYLIDKGEMARMTP